MAVQRRSGKEAQPENRVLDLTGCYISVVVPASHSSSWRVRRSHLLAALVLLFSTLSGCGYQLLGQRSEQATTVCLVTLQNDSDLPGLEVIVTRALRKEFSRAGDPRLVADPAAADVVISGRVRPLETRSNSFDSIALAVEYTVRMFLELDVAVADGERILIDPLALEESEFYLASADVEAGRKNRVEALRRIADVLAGRIHDGLRLELADRSAAEPPPTAPLEGAGEAS
jgi:outer membrane lipopolysaccharide assembly protein LptE/RlpB